MYWKKYKQHDAEARGRGSLVTLLSNDTINKPVKVIGQLISETIASEVREAKMFSVQIGATQYITSKDQYSVILRYGTDVVYKKLVALGDCEASTGQYFLDLMEDTLTRRNLDVSCCAGSTTDGAANMQGSYKRLLCLFIRGGPQPNRRLVLCTCPEPGFSGQNWQCFSSCIAFHSPTWHSCFHKGFMKKWEETNKDKRSNRTDTVVSRRYCSDNVVRVFWKAWQWSGLMVSCCRRKTVRWRQR